MIDFGKVRDACFGVNLQQQGRGYYIALELLAIIRGTIERNDLALPEGDDPPVFLRHSHDASRRLAAGSLDSMTASAIEELGGNEIAELLGRLFRSLMVSIPGRRQSNPPWQQIYLTPYVGELVHWDAVERKRRGRVAAIEEYSFRGVGAYAHRMLRTDEDRERLATTRQALRALVADGTSPLSVLARAARTRDEATPTEATLDDEPTSGRNTPPTPWIESLRRGTNFIVTRDLPAEKRIDLLMHWIPYVMARHILRVAELRIDRVNSGPIVVDFSDGPGPVRSLARRHYKDAVTTVVDAMDRTAVDLKIGIDVAESERRRKWGPPRSFFTGTMSMIGALNAPVGSQHFTFALPLLEAVVAACVPPGGQLEFSTLCDTLANDLGVIVDAEAAASSDLLEFANASDFEANAEGLAHRLRSLGVLHDYSDSTRMVSIPELKST
jgi:hypothetical protein